MQEDSDREAMNQMNGGDDATVLPKAAAPIIEGDLENPISALMALKHPERLEAIENSSFEEMKKSHYAGDDE